MGLKNKLSGVHIQIHSKLRWWIINCPIDIQFCRICVYHCKPMYTCILYTPFSDLKLKALSLNWRTHTRIRLFISERFHTLVWGSSVAFGDAIRLIQRMESFVIWERSMAWTFKDWCFMITFFHLKSPLRQLDFQNKYSFQCTITTDLHAQTFQQSESVCKFAPPACFAYFALPGPWVVVDNHRSPLIIMYHHVSFCIIMYHHSFAITDAIYNHI